MKIMVWIFLVWIAVFPTLAVWEAILEFMWDIYPAFTLFLISNGVLVFVAIKVYKFHGRFRKVEEDMKQVVPRVQTIESEMRAGFDQINGQLKVIGEKFNTIDQKFITVDKRFDAVDQRFDAVDQRFDRLDQRFDRLDQRFDRLEHSFDKLMDYLMDNRPKQLRKNQ